MFVSKSDIEILKQYPITDYLDTIGVEPKDTRGSQFLYCSPLTEERTASFFVEPKKNVFNDYSSGQKGDIIRLIQLLEQITFSETLNRLESLKNGNSSTSFCFSGKLLNIHSKPKIEVTKVSNISNHSLIRYIEQRGICIELGEIYLKEVHFINKGKNYFALGFQNDSGGYELRNGLGFKGKTANGITTFNKGTNLINIFEGFFDYLSALEYYQKKVPTNTTIILNTNSNLPQLLATLTFNYTVNSFLDNDKSGKTTVNQIVRNNLKVINQSEKLYPNHKDFNDYLLEIRNKKV